MCIRDSYKISAYDETTGKGLVRHIYVRVNRAGQSLCCVVANGRQVPREPELAAYVCAAAPGTVGVVLNLSLIHILPALPGRWGLPARR